MEKENAAIYEFAIKNLIYIWIDCTAKSQQNTGEKTRRFIWHKEIWSYRNLEPKVSGEFEGRESDFD